jgi:NAD(P)H-quinone oxidoreductase subunit M
MLLKSTTRHIRIFSAIIDDNELNPSVDTLTLDLDPDNELLWTNETIKAVQEKFKELVDASAGQDLTDYNIRRIGSDLEHYVRSLLQDGKVSYNLRSRVRNYSLGLPQVVSEAAES